MTREEFRETVGRLEAYAQENPGAYRRKVLLWALLGYGYIFLMFGLVLAIIGGLFYATFLSGHLNWLVLKGGWILLPFAWLIARSLWVAFPAPEGQPLREADAPQLFTLLRGLQEAIAGPRVHEVLVTDELNAAIAQVPRLGLFGWPKNYVVLGLPLMQAMSPEHFRAVLAHEMGHLSGRHGRFTGWIYQARQAWEQLLAQLEKAESGGTFLFARFLNWYAPRFAAYSFVLARTQEYEADRQAAAISGRENLSGALVNLQLASRLLALDFWPKLLTLATREKEPPAEAYANMFTELRGAAQHHEAAYWLRNALADETGYDDTHPCLQDRLKALGCWPEEISSLTARAESLLPAPPATTAAQALLGEAEKPLAERLGVLWREQVQAIWRDQHRQLQQDRKRLAALEEKARNLFLSPEEAWERVTLTEKLQDSAAALPLAREMVAQQPENVEVVFLLGRLLLEQKDASGLALLEQVMQQEPNAVLPGCEVAYAYFKETGRPDEARAYRQRAEQHYDRAELAQQERAGLVKGDTLIPHDLDAAAVAALHQQLDGHPEINHAYLARKQLAHWPEKPLFVLALVTATGWRSNNEKDQNLLEHLAKWLRFDGPLLLFVINSKNSWLSEKFAPLPDAEIFRRRQIPN